MHVVAPARYTARPVRRSKRPWLLASFVLLISVAGGNYLRPLPQPIATLSVQIPATPQTSVIQWPSTGQAAIAASGYGLLGTNGNQTPVATASIAKVITALCVLQKLPLIEGQSGPSYTVGPTDVGIYQDYASQNGSVIQVTEGETLTEYQALQALLLPSANNIADSLVRWVFGSQAAYATYATTYVQQHNLNQTHIGTDASGFDPSTTSTASDLANIGLLALKSPVLLAIASQKSTILPVAGTVTNYNTALGVNGITGLKTGNNDADPGAFLFTATGHIGGKDVPLTGAIMGAVDLDSALQAATKLSDSLQQNFEQVTIASSGQTVGSVMTAWGATQPIIATRTLQIVHWKATPLTETHQLQADVRQGTIGSLKVSSGQAQSKIDLQLAHQLHGPSFMWRLTRH
jgi:D-alanyl-D-alanine carboxypeptidase (penicillin-binding protein 5/6)